MDRPERTDGRYEEVGGCLREATTRSNGYAFHWDRHDSGWDWSFRIVLRTVLVHESRRQGAGRGGLCAAAFIDLGLRLLLIWSLGGLPAPGAQIGRAAEQGRGRRDSCR